MSRCLEHVVNQSGSKQVYQSVLSLVLSPMHNRDEHGRLTIG